MKSGPLVTALPPPNAQELEGYFDNLAAAATNEKAVLEQLVTNNTQLTEANAVLTEAVKQLSADYRSLRQDVNKIRKVAGGGRGGDRERGNDRERPGQPRKATPCPNCKRDVYHFADDCFELEKNASKRPSNWRSCL